jgi:hypothetical protein
LLNPVRMRVFKWSESRIAIATIVSVGFAWLLVGNTAAPAMKRLGRPNTAQFESTTPFRSVAAMRAVPM